MRRVAVAHACWGAYNEALQQLADAFRTSGTRGEFWARIVGDQSIGLPVHASEVEGATMSHEQALTWVEEHARVVVTVGRAAGGCNVSQQNAEMIDADDELADMG